MWKFASRTTFRNRPVGECEAEGEVLFTFIGHGDTKIVSFAGMHQTMLNKIRSLFHKSLNDLAWVENRTVTLRLSLAMYHPGARRALDIDENNVPVAKLLLGASVYSGGFANHG